MSKLLQVVDLVTQFHVEHGIVHAVNGISYTLDRGESLGIVGESGSGKTVGVLSLMGLIPSPPGEIVGGQAIFDGRDLLQMTQEEISDVRGREIAMVFQDPMTSLNPVLTIGRQMTEGLERHRGLSKDESIEQAAEMMALVGIPNARDRLKDYPHEFSGGQRQRIGIAMALVCSPSLLIADEPTTALDVTIQAQITDLVNNLKQKLGMAIIWITHDLGVVANLVDEVAVMYAGFIVEKAPVRGIYKQTSHPYTLGLLQSLPKITAKEKRRLIPIEGLPPDLRQEPTYCAFAPRCRYAIDRCWEEIPALQRVGPDHYSACFRADEIRSGYRVEAKAVATESLS